MSPGIQMASPSRGWCWRDPSRSAGMMCVSLGYGNKVGHVPGGAGLVVGWGNSTQIVVLEQTLLHLYKITENRDGKKLIIRYNPPT